MSGTLLLQEYRELFKDDESFARFLQIFREATDKGIAVVISGDDLIGAVLSAACTKKVLADRMVESIGKNPNLLDELADRFEEPIVEKPQER